ncbi:hypothetical protein JCM8202v2_005211 [Rhodotorula sphaerocarpa]
MTHFFTSATLCLYPLRRQLRCSGLSKSYSPEGNVTPDAVVSDRPDTSKSKVVEGCIFCGVTTKSEGFKVVHEDAEVVVFHDRSSASRVHLLAVPKRHIDNVKTLQPEDLPLLERMKTTGQAVLRQCGVPDPEQRLGFHIPPFYSVNHLHLHLLSLPLPFPGSLKYRPSPGSLPSPSPSGSREPLVPPEAGQGKERLKGWSWFVEVDQVLTILRAGERVRVGSVRGRSGETGNADPT